MRPSSFHIDIAEVRTSEGRLYLFVAIDRTSKFAWPHSASFHSLENNAPSNPGIKHLEGSTTIDGRCHMIGASVRSSRQARSTRLVRGACCASNVVVLAQDSQLAVRSKRDNASMRTCIDASIERGPAAMSGNKSCLIALAAASLAFAVQSASA
jgi:hypothetical protein